eukprot:m.32067 g.32067  ORF g.32067 m.32067 type:complete len:505 (-) comp16577_c0_seq1:25-1539(-)
MASSKISQANLKFAPEPEYSSESETECSVLVEMPETSEPERQVGIDGLVFDDDNDELVFDGDKSGHHGQRYCCAYSEARSEFGNQMLKLYNQVDGASEATLFPSGMAAIGACARSLVTPPRNPTRDTTFIVYGNELYCDVARTMKYICRQNAGVQAIAIDVCDTEDLLYIFRKHGDKIQLLHFEACTNPSGKMMDFSVLSTIKELAPSCTIVCDNTWLTAALFNPFDHGVDIVVESCTKYVSAGKCIGGVACGSVEKMKPIDEWNRVFGQFVPATIADTFTQQLKTMPQRVQAASVVAFKVAQSLESSQFPMVDRVRYPGLESHPTHARTKQYLQKGFPGCIWFHVAGCASLNSTTKKLRKQSDVIEFKTSFGGPMCRLDPWPVSADANFYGGLQPLTSLSPMIGTQTTQRDQISATSFSRSSSSASSSKTSSSQKPGCWLRLSIGFMDDVESVVRKLGIVLSVLEDKVAVKPTKATKKQTSRPQKRVLQTQFKKVETASTASM